MNIESKISAEHLEELDAIAAELKANNSEWTEKTEARMSCLDDELRDIASGTELITIMSNRNKYSQGE